MPVSTTPAPTVTLPDGTPVRLGCVFPESRPQALKLKSFLTRAAGNPPPESIDYVTKAAPALKRMYLNNRFGCCVISGKFHDVGVWSGNDTGTAVQGSDNEVLSQYRSICGPQDAGCVVTEVLDHFKTKGLMVGGKVHKIDGYVAVDNRDSTEVKIACLLFGGLTIAMNLPSEWINDANEGAVWEVPRHYQFVGGHDVSVVDYNRTGVRVSTWGLVLTITWAALADPKIVMECYAKLSPDWYNNDQLAPNGLDVTALKDALATLSHGDLPPWEPPVTPPGPVTPPPGPTPPGPAPAPPGSLKEQIDKMFDAMIAHFAADPLKVFALQMLKRVIDSLWPKAVVSSIAPEGGTAMMAASSCQALPAGPLKDFLDKMMDDAIAKSPWYSRFILQAAKGMVDKWLSEHGL